MFVRKSEHKRVLDQWEKTEIELNIVRRQLYDADQELMRLRQRLDLYKRVDAFRVKQLTRMRTVNKKLLELIEQKFQERLQAKTGWGRNDVMAEYKAAVNEALLELLDQQSNSKES